MVTARKGVAAGFGGPEVLRNIEVAQVTGGYTTAITTSASDVFAKPSPAAFAALTGRHPPGKLAPLNEG